MENGLRTKLKDMVNTFMLMALNMKVIGTMTSNMAREEKFGRMELHSKANTNQGRKMVMANSNGQTDQCTKANLLTIACTVLDIINGLMEESTKVTGRKT